MLHRIILYFEQSEAISFSRSIPEAPYLFPHTIFSDFRGRMEYIMITNGWIKYDKYQGL